MKGLPPQLLEVFSVTILILLFQPNYALDVLGTVKSAVNVFDVSNVTNQKTTISSSGPNISGAKKIVYITATSYCSDLSKWDCVYCKKAKALGYEYSSTVSNKASNTFGVIAVNTATKEIVVAFRGTYNVANILQDATLNQVAPGGGGGSKPKKSGGIVKKIKNKVKNAVSGKKGKSATSSSSGTIKVHNGFLKATKSLYPQVVKQLTALLKKNKGYSVVITGHSLGAAIASVTLYMLRQRINVPSTFPTPSYSYFGYGEPRVGNQAYADYWNKQKIPVTRIVSKADIIPHVPTASLGYVHHGTEVWISPSSGDKSCSKKVYEDFTCSDSLGPAYLVTDHLVYWDVNYAGCAIQNPITVLTQFVVPVG